MIMSPLTTIFIILFSIKSCNAAAYGSMDRLDMIGMSPINNLSTTPVVCKSMDIRNNISSFRALENCTVVEGFVQILLLDNVTEADFKNISFPKLTEITDYLLLYRVTALRSVGQLFPNLAVIRGQEKMFRNSLIIYEMANLQDIGLHSLREISSGLVRIDKNPSLCFVHTINWKVITVENGDHFIKNIKSTDECPLCPGEDDQSTACANNPNECWNRDHCQVICPEKCKNSCDSKGNCCDSTCIGCVDDQPHNCLVCRNVVAIGTHCQPRCPNDTYMYLNRRCVTREACIAMPRPLQLSNSKTSQDKSHKILNMNGVRECVLECPPDHTESNNECVKCEAGRCQKECPATVVDSVTMGKELRGCTHINGSLEIQIRGGKNVVSALDENLKMIEVIDGYLKIVRSFPLISLNFFKKLRLIRGNTLESNKYVIFVLDNQNLQELWDWNNRNLTIERGKLFFHFNPLLCLDKIRTLQKKTHLPDYDELEVALNSNGDKIACHITQLNVTASPESKAIKLKWEPFLMKDHRKLLGYTVYIIEASFRNITLFDGRDACGGDGWRLEDVSVSESKITHLVSQLKPYTQYAFYVKTFTIASEDSGAQSPIQYIRTKPGVPSVPLKLAYTNKNHSVYLTWQAPKNPNGEITYYVVGGNAVRPVNQENDFCNSIPRTNIPPPQYQPPPRINDNQTCECTNESDQKKGGIRGNELTVEDQIIFEDKLYDMVYVKGVAPRGDNSLPQIRNRRTTFHVREKRSELFNEDINEIENSFSMIVNTTEVYIANLTHFTLYNVYVRACRDSYDKEKDLATCSANATQIIKTKKRDDVDVVSNIIISNVTTDSAIVMWDEPPNPNGFIETYHVVYKNVDDSDHHIPPICIPGGKNNSRRSYNLVKLTPGNWSVQILVRSVAGPGIPSKLQYFYVKQPVNVTYYVLGIILTICIVTGLVLYKFRYKCIQKEDMKLITSVNPDYIPTAYVPDEWEVPREMIKIIDELGQGSFGKVYEGIAKEIRGKTNVRCAVKSVNEEATNRERIEFLNEASVMKAFDTSHVVRLLGVVSQGHPTLVIMELMANGDLKTYLRRQRPDFGVDGIERQPPTLKQILQMAIEIADGMAYLSAKKFLHRDVAARNCMVSENLVVKVGDFGMTRDIYETDYYRKESKGLLPVRWMAPESLKDGVFTSSSDVWSYGVVLWEMATLASQPYQGLANDQVLRYVIGGNIMERPENCPDILYYLMKRCWRHRPNERPTFMQLCEFLLPYARSGFDLVSYYHSATAAGIVEDIDDATIPLRIDEPMDNGSDHDIDNDGDGNDELQFISYERNGYVSHRPNNGTN